MRRSLLAITTLVVIVIIVVLVVVLRTSQSDDEYHLLPPPEQINIDTSDSTIHLNWDPVSGAEFYTIYYSKQPFSDHKSESDEIQVLTPITKNDVKITSMPKGNHYFKITSSRSPKHKLLRHNVEPVESEPTPLTATTVDVCTKPRPPREFRAVISMTNDDSDSHDVQLKWQAVTSAEGYKIYLEGGDVREEIDVPNGAVTNKLLKAIPKEFTTASIASYAKYCGEGEVTSIMLTPH